MIRKFSSTIGTLLFCALTSMSTSLCAADVSRSRRDPISDKSPIRFGTTYWEISIDIGIQGL